MFKDVDSRSSSSSTAGTARTYGNRSSYSESSRVILSIEIKCDSPPGHSRHCPPLVPISEGDDGAAPEEESMDDAAIVLSFDPFGLKGDDDDEDNGKRIGGDGSNQELFPRKIGGMLVDDAAAKISLSSTSEFNECQLKRHLGTPHPSVQQTRSHRSGGGSSSNTPLSGATRATVRTSNVQERPTFDSFRGGGNVQEHPTFDSLRDDGIQSNSEDDDDGDEMELLENFRDRRKRSWLLGMRKVFRRMCVNKRREVKVEAPTDDPTT